MTTSTNGEAVTISGSPSTATLGITVSATFGQPASGMFGGSVGAMFGQGIIYGVSLNNTGAGRWADSFTASAGLGYNIPGGLGNLFGRVARLFSGSVTQTIGQ